MPSLLSPADATRFHTDGFIIVRAMFDAEESELLRCAMEQDPEVAAHLLDRLDAHGAATRIALWNRAGDSVYGIAARCERMVDSMEALWQDFGERAAVERKLRAAIVGSNATVKAGLETLVGETGADEVIVVTDTYEHEDRLQSYRRVADVAVAIGVKSTVAVDA